MGDVAATDLDGDGFPDLIGTVSTYIRIVNGADPASPPVSTDMRTGVGYVRLADMTGDGRLDAVVTTWDPYGGAGLSIQELLPDRSFGAVTGFVTGISAFTEPFIVGDLDLDGRPELAFATWEGLDGPIVVSGDVVNGFSVIYAGEVRYDSIQIADVNSDGWPDLVMARYEYGSPPHSLDVAYGGCR
jgi:hypothetical protein